MSRAGARPGVLAAALLALLPAGPAGAGEAADADAAALSLADLQSDEVAQASDWRSFVEAGAGASVRRGDGAMQGSRRLSVDIRYEHSLAPGARVFLADRLDLGQPAPGVGEHAVNTLKEAYLSWQLAADAMLDLGRINVRNGVAAGYNPTDYFREGAVRAPISINPASLRENRQGSVMLRAQRLWDGGSLTALYSPALVRESNPEGLALDVGATNARHRGLLALSQRVGGLTPQWLVFHEEARSTRFGFNLTGLLNDATVAYLEWSGGRSATQLAEALHALTPACECSAWHNRIAGGLTYTTPDKLSLTAELHHNGAGLESAAWNALRQGPPALYGQYRSALRSSQEMPTRRALFLQAQWQDALLPRLDLGLMHNLDLVDRSRRVWAEARYHVDRVEYAFQWVLHGGEAGSVYGAVPEARGWQLLARYYF
ncbi:hypothetical protein [Zoogloea sp.]|uniref:hypothetical protein n=1 Tax=Zoogloea sp. TaxID=49181 RepID=UPI001415D0DF|nr:MAG: hypothetical protein F9K15_03770 [Zoogloea sp.]